MNNPWQCMRCKKINAPWMPHCYCEPIEKSHTEKIRDIIGEKWVLIFTDERDEVFQVVIRHHKNIPNAIKNVLLANGHSIFLEDRTPWRMQDKEKVLHNIEKQMPSNQYDTKWLAHCPICSERLNGRGLHECQGDKI